MLYHISQSAPDGKLWNNFVSHGYISVDLFFILSGLIISKTYGSWFFGGLKTKSYLKFLGRRIARVYPLYFAVTLLFITLGMWERNYAAIMAPSPTITILANFLMIQSWGLAHCLVTPAWSISTEFAAYLLFPVLLWSSLRTRVHTVTMLVVWYGVIYLLSIIPDGYAGMVRGTGQLNITGGLNPWGLARCLAFFSVGILSWRVSMIEPVSRMISGSVPAVALTIAIIALLCGWNTDFALAVLFPFLIINVASDRGIVARLLGGRIVYWLGTISYSIYLVHVLMVSVKLRVIGRIQPVLPNADTILTLLLCLVAIAMAAVTYYRVERPGRRLLDQWISGGSTRLKATRLGERLLTPRGAL